MPVVNAIRGFEGLGRALATRRAHAQRQAELDRRYEADLGEAKIKVAEAERQNAMTAANQAAQAFQARDLATAQGLAGSEEGFERIQSSVGEDGMPDPQVLQEVTAEEQQRQGRMRRMVAIAENMDPKLAPKFLATERERWEAEVQQDARNNIVELIQDGVSSGSYNFEGDNEVSEEIGGRLKMLTEGLESGEMDAGQAQKIEQEIRGMVVEENEERMARDAGIAQVDLALSRIDSTTPKAGKLRRAKALFKAGVIDNEDLVDMLFEEETGRKTSRADQMVQKQEIRTKAASILRMTQGRFTKEDLDKMVEIMTAQPDPEPEGNMTDNPALAREMAEMSLKMRQDFGKPALPPIQRQGGPKAVKIKSWKDSSKKIQGGLEEAIIIGIQKDEIKSKADSDALMRSKGVDPNSVPFELGQAWRKKALGG